MNINYLNFINQIEVLENLIDQNLEEENYNEIFTQAIKQIQNYQEIASQFKDQTLSARLVSLEKKIEEIKNAHFTHQSSDKDLILSKINQKNLLDQPDEIIQLFIEDFKKQTGLKLMLSKESSKVVIHDFEIINMNFENLEKYLELFPDFEIDLKIYNYPDSKNEKFYDLLKKFPEKISSLKYLEQNYIQGNDFEDIDFTSLPNLRKVTLLNISKELRNIVNLSQIEELTIANSPQLDFVLLNIPKLKSLTLLNINYLRNLYIAHADSIEKLKICNCGYLRDLPKMNHLKELDLFKISWRLLLPVGNENHLEKLTLIGDFNLEKNDFLIKCQNLKSLTMNDSYLIKTFFLETETGLIKPYLPHLEELLLEDVKAENLKFSFTKLPLLKNLSLKDSNFHSIEGLNDCKHLDVINLQQAKLTDQAIDLDRLIDKKNVTSLVQNEKILKNNPLNSLDVETIKNEIIELMEEMENIPEHPTFKVLSEIGVKKLFALIENHINIYPDYDKYILKSSLTTSYSNDQKTYGSLMASFSHMIADELKKGTLTIEQYVTLASFGRHLMALFSNKKNMANSYGKIRKEDFITFFDDEYKVLETFFSNKNFDDQSYKMAYRFSNTSNAPELIKVRIYEYGNETVELSAFFNNYLVHTIPGNIEKAKAIALKIYSDSLFSLDEKEIYQKLGEFFWWWCEAKPVQYGDPSIAEELIKGVLIAKNMPVKGWKEGIIPWVEAMKCDTPQECGSKFESFFEN